MIKYVVTLDLGCFFPLLWPGVPFVIWYTRPLLGLGMLDTKVNKCAQRLLRPGTGWRLYVCSLWEFRAD